MPDTPLTDQRLAAIRAYHERTTHPDWRNDTGLGQLLGEVDRLRAELAERTQLLVDESSERERAQAELAQACAELTTAKAAGYRQAADNATEMVQLHGRDADAEMLLVFLQRGAELRERFAAAQAAGKS